MRASTSILVGALLGLWSQRPAAAQDVGTDLTFMESCRAERNCVCDSLDDWFACVADAPRLVDRGFDPTALVASIVSEADRHLATECAPSAQGSRHRLCGAASALRDIALGTDPKAAFEATDLNGDPLPDALNDEWRQFLDGSISQMPPPDSGGLGLTGGLRLAASTAGGPMPNPNPSPSPNPSPGPQPRPGNQIPGRDALRRGGSPQVGNTIPGNAASQMCQNIAQAGSNESYARCFPPVCDCPSGPVVNIVLRGNTVEVSPNMVCQTISYGMGDLIDAAAHTPGGATAMLSILGMAASILDAIAKDAVPILCGYARNSVYISDECINNYSAAECEGARLALSCLGCDNSGNKECSARCLCFWQALANYNEDRRRREGWWCRNFGIRCPDERGYFYRLGVSCLNPPPGGIRNGGYR
jgi:hypothetical protein